MVLITLMIMDNPTTNTKFKVNPYSTEIKPITRAPIKNLIKLIFDTAAIPRLFQEAHNGNGIRQS